MRVELRLRVRLKLVKVSGAWLLCHSEAGGCLDVWGILRVHWWIEISLHRLSELGIVKAGEHILVASRGARGLMGDGYFLDFVLDFTSRSYVGVRV